MSHYTMVEELRPRGQRFVERIHRMRMLGTALCMLPIAAKAAGRNQVDGTREPAAPLTVVKGARAA